MPDHLNIYEPYERKGAGHEDALTRAFLLVLRGVPVAHATWLDLVDRAHRRNAGCGVPHLHELPEPQVYMQTGSVPDGVKRVVSLVLTDEHVPVPQDAAPSDRGQVLDGVVAYLDLAVVIENKPWHGNIWKGQLHVNVDEGVEHDPNVACVTWHDIVESWSRLLEAGHLGTAETVLLNDFLDYVEEHFPGLRPFSKVALCGHDRSRLARRCKALLEGLVPTDQGRVAYHRGWGYYLRLDKGRCAEQVGFMPGRQGRALILEFAPADTGAQARRMYGPVPFERVAALLDADLWTGVPNFHLGHVTSNLFHVPSNMSLEAYWAFWTENHKAIRRWKLAEFEDAWAFLVEHGVLDPKHEARWHATTTNTNRKSIDFRPGVTILWTLPVEEAALLDARGDLEATVREAIEQGADALRLKLPW